MMSWIIQSTHGQIDIDSFFKACSPKCLFGCTAQFEDARLQGNSRPERCLNPVRQGNLGIDIDSRQNNRVDGSIHRIEDIVVRGGSVRQVDHVLNGGRFELLQTVQITRWAFDRHRLG